jgi:hypothetical protein
MVIGNKCIMSSDLQAIKRKLQRLLLRFYLVVFWHCLLIYGLLVWLAVIGQLALGQAMWPLVWWGLLIPAAYAGYRIISRPSLFQIACLADQRCQLRDKLVTAWQYRHSGRPALPLLLKQTAGDLDRIKPSLIFSFKLSRWWLMVAAFLLAGNWYFSLYPLYSRPSPVDAQLTKVTRLTPLADRIEKLSRGLNQIASEEEFPQLARTAERLEQLGRELEDSGSESQVLPRLHELRQEIARSIAGEEDLPEMPKAPEAGNESALLEIEVKSGWLKNLMYKLKQQSLSPEQIQNRILRELVRLMDHLLLFKLPIKGNKPQGLGGKPAESNAGPSRAGGGESMASGLGTDTGVGRYAESANQDYRPGDIGRFGWNTHWPSSRTGAEELAAETEYSYLPPRYQQQIDSVLADQRIPPAYRRQVRDYFDALNN